MARLIALTAGIVCAMGLYSVPAAESSDGLSKVYESKPAGPPQTVVYDAVSAMSFFRTLTGHWTNSPIEADGAGASSHAAHGYSETSGATGIKTSVRTIGAGSVVEWASFEGTPMEMVTMLHMDGPDKLYYTHYCAARNVPKMQFHKTGKPGEIKFDFVSGENLNPAVDSHAHAITFQVVDTNTIVQELTTYSEGKPAFEKSVFRRTHD